MMLNYKKMTAIFFVVLLIASVQLVVYFDNDFGKVAGQEVCTVQGVHKNRVALKLICPSGEEVWESDLHSYLQEAVKGQPPKTLVCIQKETFISRKFQCG